MNKVLVWGLGKSGRSALDLLSSKGIQAIGGDDAEGDRWEDFINDMDTLVLSPGIPPSHHLWKTALDKGIEVIGELELSYRFFEGEVIAITGTDGKSTTTSLIHHLLSSRYEDVHTAGNIGTPLSELVMKNPKALAVVEVSSFQGKTLSTFRPSIGSFLNFSQDHLDWHPDMEDYLWSKHNVFRRQRETDTFIEALPQREIKTTPTTARRIDISKEVEIRGREVFFREEKLFKVADLPLRGIHNLRNVITASVIALLKGVPPEVIAERVKEFKGLPFRMELVARFNGVEVYNDSKSTTPNSLKSALESFPDSSVVLIAGGKDKGADFSPLREIFERKVKASFLIGETKNLIKTAFGGGSNIKTLNSLEDAVKLAVETAKPGDFILFSPGCSSFDMFKNYVERGEAFNRLIHRYAPKG